MKLLQKLALFLPLLAVLAISSRATAMTCYAYDPNFGFCTTWGPTPPANANGGCCGDPVLSNGQVAGFTNTNGHGAGGFNLILHSNVYYSGPLGDWDSASWQINSVKCGPKANAIFYSDASFTNAVGSCSPGQTVTNTGGWSVSSIHVWQSP